MADEKRPGLSVIKNSSGKHVEKGQKIIAYNIYTQYMKQGHTKTQSVKRTAADTGLSESTVWKIIAERDNTGTFTSPSKKRIRADLFDHLDEEAKEVLTYIVHNFFQRREFPTLDKVFKAVNENKNLPPMSRSTLHRMLKKLGFMWEKRGNPDMRPSKLTERRIRATFKNSLKKHKNVVPKPQFEIIYIKCDGSSSPIHILPELPSTSKAIHYSPLTVNCDENAELYNSTVDIDQKYEKPDNHVQLISPTIKLECESELLCDENLK